jgi:hypothetical protein
MECKDQIDSPCWSMLVLRLHEGDLYVSEACPSEGRGSGGSKSGKVLDWYWGGKRSGVCVSCYSDEYPPLCCWVVGEGMSEYWVGCVCFALDPRLVGWCRVVFKRRSPVGRCTSDDGESAIETGRGAAWARRGEIWEARVVW